jgi:hypothetical protein
VKDTRHRDEDHALLPVVGLSFSPLGIGSTERKKLEITVMYMYFTYIFSVKTVLQNTKVFCKVHIYT